jgi:hypothetical protein
VTAASAPWGRTAAERSNGHTEDVSHIIEIVPSNLPGIGQQAA